MTEKTQLFQFAGERPAEKTEAEKKKKWYQDRPVAAELFLGLLVLGCHCDCRSLRRSQRMCTGVAGRASDAADRDLFVGAESSSCHFSSGRCGKIQCDYDFCRDRNDKLDKHCKGCADRSTADPEQ